MIEERFYLSLCSSWEQNSPFDTLTKKYACYLWYQLNLWPVAALPK
jgi:hypothetical protein